VLARQAQEFSPSAWGAEGNRSSFAFDVEVSPVPEPTTTMLAALGIPVLLRPLAHRFDPNFCKPRKAKA
jgi:hypothetical protein